MRWPQFGRQSRRGAAARRGGSTPDAAARPVAAASWARLAPITSSWWARSPLTAAPIELAAPLVRRVRRGALIASPTDGVPSPGRVVGLATVVAALDPVPRPEPPSYFRNQSPLRHVTARPISEHAPLTAATDRYVGEPIAPPPVVPAPPTPSPGRPAVRRAGLEPQVEAATEAGARFREALANLPNSGLPRYVSPSEREAGQQDPPPAVPPAAAPPPGSTVQPTSRGEPVRLTHRRNTLAQSRRLGLGAPLRQEEAPNEAPDAGESEPDAASDAEPDTDQPREPIRPVVAAAEPIARGTAQPSAATTPLVFRARQRAQREPDTPPPSRPLQRATVTRPPAELAQALRSSHGIDVADVPIQRDAGAGSEARERRARAFTRGARVFLPDAAGPVTSGAARGLLAHELVHAAQQRRLGGSLPEPHTPEGRVLEAEAAAAERMYSAPVPFDQPELVHAPPPVTAGWVENRITQYAANDPAKNYFDVQVNEALTGQQREAFQAAAKEAVQKVIHDQRPDLQPSAKANPFTSTSAEDNAERQFLDVINTELAKRDEPPQLELSEQDKIAVRRLFGAQRAGGRGGTDEIPDHESSRLSRWQEKHLGGAMALGADFGGFMNFFRVGQIDHRVGDAEPDGGAGPRGARGSGAGTTSTGQTIVGTSSTSTTTAGGGTTGTRPPPRSLGAGRSSGVIPDHESSRQSRWQEQHLGGAMALGADFGGFMNLFNVGRIDHRVGDDLPASQSGAEDGGRAPTRRSDGSTFDASTQSVRDTTGPSTQQEQSRRRLSDFEMDDIAVRIYDRLRSRLRRELLVDRERAGLLTDFR